MDATTERAKTKTSWRCSMAEEPEVWCAIPGVPEYEASTLGRVMRRDSRSRRALKPAFNTKGYPSVTICTGGRRVTSTVHRLVCAAFHGPRPDGMDCAHWDNDKTNSRPENLRWATRSENIMDKHRHGTMLTGDRNVIRQRPELLKRGEQSPNAKLTEADVRAIRASSLTQVAAATQYGVSQTQISDIRRNKSWRHIEMEQAHV